MNEGDRVTPIFPKWTNQLPTMVAVGAPIVLVSVVLFVWYFFSPKWTDVGYSPKQPVAFSHQLHAGQMGMDCRYCHSTVERAAFASIPPTETCMGCHSMVQAKSPRLQLVRDSYQSGKPIEWVKVHMLPDHAHFNHSAHVTAGVNCASCHGRIVSRLSPQSRTKSGSKRSGHQPGLRSCQSRLCSGKRSAPRSRRESSATLLRLPLLKSRLEPGECKHAV
jgi:hypothetical protein